MTNHKLAVSSLPAELPQVMVGVQIAPAKPFRSRHWAEDWMRDRKIYGGATKTVEHGEKMLAVVFKYDWCRSAVTLFHLWASWDTLGHRKGKFNAIHLINVRCKKPLAVLAVFSPSASRYESQRWQMAWCGDIFPHNRRSDELSAERRVLIERQSTGDSSVCIDVNHCNARVAVTKNRVG